MWLSIQLTVIIIIIARSSFKDNPGQKGLWDALEGRGLGKSTLAFLGASPSGTLVVGIEFYMRQCALTDRIPRQLISDEGPLQHNLCFNENHKSFAQES